MCIINVYRIDLKSPELKINFKIVNYIIILLSLEYTKIGFRSNFICITFICIDFLYINTFPCIVFKN